MELAEDVRQKVVIKIEQLKIKVSVLCEQLQYVQDLSRAFSEGLSIGFYTGDEVFNEVNGLRGVVSYLERQIRILENYLNGSIDIIADEERLKSEALKVEDDLAKLQMRKLDLQDRLQIITEAKKGIFD